MLGNQEPNPRPASYDPQLEIYWQASWSIQLGNGLHASFAIFHHYHLVSHVGSFAGKKARSSRFFGDVDVVMRILL